MDVKNIELITLLKENKTQISGISKGVTAWENIEKTYCTEEFWKHNTQDAVIEDENAAIYIYSNSKIEKLSTKSVILVQLALDNINKLHDKNLKVISKDLLPEIIAIFEQHLKSQTLLTSIFNVFWNKSAYVIADIFRDAFATCFHKQTEDILFNTLANNIGRIILELTYNKYISTQKIKRAELLVPFFEFLYSLDAFSVENVITLQEDEVDRVFEVFIKVFKFTEYRYLFAKEDLITLIIGMTLRILVEQIMYSENPTKENSFFGAMFNCSVFDKIHSKILTKPYENKQQKYIVLKNILYFAMEKIQLQLGAEVLTILENKVIHISSTVMEHKRSPYKVKLIREEFYSELASDFPRIYPNELELKEKLGNFYDENRTKTTTNFEGTGNIITDYKKQKLSTVSNNYYITGKMKDSKIFDENTKNNRFTINSEFSIEFFKTLLSLQKWCFKKSKKISSLDNLPEIPDDELSKILAFSSQIYEINLLKLYHSANSVLKKVIVLHSLDSLNFSTFVKLQFSDEIYSNHLKPYYQLYKRLKNKIHSKKVIYNEMFYQFYIMAHFNYFFYGWFSDSRGRKQLTSLLTLQNMSIIRCFITFYKQPNLFEYCCYIYNYKNEKQLEIQEIFELREKKIKALIKDKLNREFKVSEKFNYTFLECCEKIDCGKAFLTYGLLKDYKRFKEDPKDYRFKQMIGLDATNSGLQVMAIIFKSRNLASNCNLTGAPKDVYEECKMYIIGCVNQITGDVNEIKNNLLRENKPFGSEEAMRYFDSIKKSSYDAIFGEDHKHNILEYRELTETLENQALSELILNRSVMKVLSMTKPYSATMPTACEQMLDKIINDCLKKAIWIDNKQLEKIRRCLRLIYKMFNNWFNKTLPEASLLSNAAKRFINTKTKMIANFSFEHDFFTFSMYPTKTIKHRLNINSAKNITRKRLVLSKPTENYDFLKARNALPANFVHYGDAFIVSAYNLLVNRVNKKKESPIYTFVTNHDSYYVPITYLLRLRKDLRICYRKLYDVNLLEAFKSCPEIYNYMISQLKQDLTLDELCNNDYFVK